MKTPLHAAITSTLVLATAVPQIVPPTIPAPEADEVVNLAFLPDRMRHHFAPGNKPQPRNLLDYSEPYSESSDYMPRGYPGETYRLGEPWAPRTVQPAGQEVCFYVHTKGHKVGKTIAHRGPWTAQEVEYARIHGLVLQTRGTRRGTDRANAINRREAVKRILAGKDIMGV